MSRVKDCLGRNLSPYGTHAANVKTASGNSFDSFLRDDYLFGSSTILNVPTTPGTGSFKIATTQTASDYDLIGSRVVRYRARLHN